jgi:RimJ/RimL family protein N-acetyltransferase
VRINIFADNAIASVFIRGDFLSKYISERGIFMKEIITITISDFLSNELAEKICLLQWHNSSPRFVNQLRHFSLYDGKYCSDCFHVVASNISGDVIGWLYCLQNKTNRSLWYYGDLFVSPSYRRNKIASRMLVAAIERLKESGATILRTYVDPNNTASINLQKSSGFIEKPYEKFDDLSNEGCIMFELCLPSIDGKAQVPCHKTTGEIPRRYLKITHSAPKLSRLHTPHGPSRLD